MYWLTANINVSIIRSVESGAFQIATGLNPWQLIATIDFLKLIHLHSLLADNFAVAVIIHYH